MITLARAAATLAVALTGLGAAAPSVAHDFSATEANSFMDLIADPAATEGTDATTVFVVQSVIDQYKLWDAGQTLSVCFFGGAQDLRAFFVEVSKVWDDVSSTNFDFGSAPAYRTCSSSSPSHIRVSFKSGSNWSYVGTDSASHDLASASLNISPPASMAVANRRSLGGTILHELGHALAMKHEHQSPEANCESELNWQLVYSQLGAPPNSWDKATIDRNMRQFVKTPRLRVSEYDRKSIMHYSLPAEWFVNGKNSSCWVPRNDSVSDLDVAAIEDAYPATPQQQDQYIKGLESASATTIKELGLPPEAIKAIEAEIDAAINAVPGRNIESTLSVTVGNISTAGSCSPVAVGTSGATNIVCTFGPGQ